MLSENFGIPERVAPKVRINDPCNALPRGSSLITKEEKYETDQYNADTSETDSSLKNNFGTCKLRKRKEDIVRYRNTTLFAISPLSINNSRLQIFDSSNTIDQDGPDKAMELVPKSDNSNSDVSSEAIVVIEPSEKQRIQRGTKYPSVENISQCSPALLQQLHLSQIQRFGSSHPLSRHSSLSSYERQRDNITTSSDELNLKCRSLDMETGLTGLPPPEYSEFGRKSNLRSSEVKRKPVRRSVSWGQTADRVETWREKTVDWVEPWRRQTADRHSSCKVQQGDIWADSKDERGIKDQCGRLEYLKQMLEMERKMLNAYPDRLALTSNAM